MTTTHSTCRSLHSQIGLRARQRLDTVLPSSTFNLFRPPWNPAPSPSAYFRRTFHQTFQARDLSKSEEKLVEIIKRKNEAYEQVLAQVRRSVSRGSPPISFRVSIRSSFQKPVSCNPDSNHSHPQIHQPKSPYPNNSNSSLPSPQFTKNTSPSLPTFNNPNSS